jgi:hypothetical protein
MLSIGILLAFDAAPVVHEITPQPYSEATIVSFVTQLN